MINQFHKAMLNRADIAGREDAVTALETLIDNGGYKPGDRLPAERELILSLGMSRNVLRRALRCWNFAV